jgi:hypothetical protein
MARYVVLEFEHNEDADMFTQDMLHDGESVVGVFAKPTQFCKCKGGKGRIHAYTRGRKFGWWVCSTCKKPQRVHKPDRLMRHVVSQGVNLLPGIKNAPASVWTWGWGVLGRSA